MMIHISICRLYKLRNSITLCIELENLLVFLAILNFKIMSQMESQNDNFLKMLVKKKGFKKLDEKDSDIFMAKIPRRLLFE